MCLKHQARLSICDPLQRSRMRSYHHHSWNWSSSSGQVCPLSALTWKLSDEHHCSLPLQENMAQRGAGKHDQWRVYMTILVANDGIIKPISILTAVIGPMMKFDVDQPRDCFRQHVKWTLAILSQLLSPSPLDLDRVHRLPHALQQEKDAYCLPEGNQWITNALHWIRSGGDHIALLYCALLIEYNGI